MDTRSGSRAQYIVLSVLLDNYMSCNTDKNRQLFGMVYKRTLADERCICNAAGSLYCSVDRMSTGWECRGTTSCSYGNMSRIEWSIREVFKSRLTAMSGTTPNRTLTQRNAKRLLKRILRCPCRYWLVVVCSVGSDPRLMPCCHGCRMSIWLTRLGLSSVSYKPLSDVYEKGRRFKWSSAKVCLYCVYCDFVCIACKWTLLVVPYRWR